MQGHISITNNALEYLGWVKGTVTQRIKLADLILSLFSPSLPFSSHSIVKKLFALKTSDPDLAKMLAEQVQSNPRGSF